MFSLFALQLRGIIEHPALILRNQIVAFCRWRILSVLRPGILDGRLVITDPQIGTIVLGSSKADHFASLAIHDTAFWVRIFISYDIGFSESWMASECDVSDMREFLNIYIDNMTKLDGLSTPFNMLYFIYHTVLSHFFRHTLKMSVSNASGYDLSNNFYSAMLSTEMKYSCPLWSEEEGGPSGDLKGFQTPHDLEAAQARKIAHVLSQAKVQPGFRILEIGSGWGGLAIAAAKVGCTVDTITVSEQQYIGAKENIQKAGVDDHVKVHFLDYRSLPAEFESAFDACVSLEMLEAVGRRNMPIYASIIAWALKDTKACRVVLSATTYPESRYKAWQGNDFTRKYHWPNCFIPSPDALITDFRKYFDMVKFEDMSENYPRCLREWRRRLDDNWSGLADVLIKQYPELKDPSKMSMLKRRWEYMFIYMDVSYSRGGLGLGVWTFTRPRLCFRVEEQ